LSYYFDLLFVLQQFLQTLTNLSNFGPLYTELTCNITHIPASPTYCCYTTLGKQVNCIVITLAAKVTQSPLHKIKLSSR